MSNSVFRMHIVIDSLMSAQTLDVLPNPIDAYSPKLSVRCDH
jgi:hypothetical protein